MLSLGGRANAHAHLDEAPAHHALIACGPYWLMPILTERPRSMPVSQVFAPARCRSRNTVISACPIAAAALSLMLAQSGRRLVRLRSQLQRSQSCSSRRGAGAGGSVTCRVPSRSAALAQPALAVDAAARRARSRRFYTLISATMASRSIGAARLKRKTFGRSNTCPRSSEVIFSSLHRFVPS